MILENRRRRFRLLLSDGRRRHREAIGSDEFDLEVGAGLGELAGKQWRIGLMGSSSNDVNINRCLRAFEEVLC